jgi:hypothetical protein
MPDPPVPVLMLYDPEEFWEKVRATVREEIARADSQNALLQSAIEKAGLPLKPAYTSAEITALFQLSEGTLEEWAEHGLLRLITIGHRSYILYNDLRELFHAT